MIYNCTAGATTIMDNLALTQYRSKPVHRWSAYLWDKGQRMCHLETVIHVPLYSMAQFTAGDTTLTANLAITRLQTVQFQYSRTFLKEGQQLPFRRVTTTPVQFSITTQCIVGATMETSNLEAH